MKKIKCYKCKLSYDEKQGIYCGFASFCCGNCIKELTEKSHEPINKKRFFFFAIFLFLIPFVLSEEIVINETLISLYAPSNTTFNYSYTNSTHNFTLTLPIMCMLNSTNATPVNTTSSICEVQRSLEFGETYVNTNNQCNLQFSCPSCDTQSNRNVSYKIRWKVERINETIFITYLNTNETRDYGITESFRYEDEFSVMCPDRGQSFTNPYINFNPINLTGEEWYYYCLEPFGRYGETIKDLTNSLTEANTKITQSCIDIQASNLELARRNEELSLNENNYQECEVKYSDLTNLNLANEKEAKDCIIELNDVKSSNSFKSIFLLILIIINAIILLGAIAWYGFLRISGVGDMK